MTKKQLLEKLALLDDETTVHFAILHYARDWEPRAYTRV